jgi:hypothetical protein
MHGDLGTRRLVSSIKAAVLAFQPLAAAVTRRDVLPMVSEPLAIKLASTA